MKEKLNFVHLNAYVILNLYECSGFQPLPKQSSPLSIHDPNTKLCVLMLSPSLFLNSFQSSRHYLISLDSVPGKHIFSFLSHFLANMY